MSVSYVTEHFRWTEFWCHDGREPPDEVKPNIRRLCETVLEPLRDAWGGPIIVVSGWRSQQWNFKVGGAAGSRHLTGEAADIRPISLGALPMFKGMIEKLLTHGKLAALGGLGWYPDRWVHVDVRAHQGHLARWEGKGVGSEVA